MIDIYLNPDQDLLYTTCEENGLKEISQSNIKACEALLKEM